MARKKRMRTMQSNDDYLSQQEPPTQLSPDDNIPSGGTDVVIEDDQGVRRTRGKTLLRHLWELAAGHRIVVDHNNLFQPIKSEAGLLGQYLGTIARNGTICSLSFKDWKLLMKVAKTKILDTIKIKFLYHFKCEEWILKSMNRRWTQYKSHLKAMYFDEQASIEVMYNKVPEGVIGDQWICLVDYWRSDEGKKASERNKKARGMQKNTHTAGTKSFARLSHEMKMSHPDKKEPTRVEVYLATHKRKDGTYLDESVALALQKQIEDYPENEINLGGRVGWEGDVFSQVLGKDKNGHVRGVGLVPMSKNVVKPSHHFEGMQIISMDEKLLFELVQKMIGTTEKLSNRVEELQNEVAKLKSTSSSSQISHNSPIVDLTKECETSTHPNQGGFMNLLDPSSTNWQFPDF